MKRTTYILIGILVSVLIVLVGGVLYISTMKSDKDLYTLTLPDKMAQAELTGIRAVKLYASGLSEVWLAESCVNFVPSVDGKTKVTYPESGYLKVTQESDTLVICLDLSRYNLPKRKNHYNVSVLQANSLQLTIEADANLAFLSNSILGMRTYMSGLQLDSLNAYTKNQGLQLDSCSIQALRVGGNNTSFTADKSTISRLYLDLDDIENWRLDNCAVGTEYLTGSGSHQNHLQKGECGQMFWTPKQEDAELVVTMPEKGCLTLQPR